MDDWLNNVCQDGDEDDDDDDVTEPADDVTAAVNGGSAAAMKSSRPAAGAGMKHSDSSFGLHSPDSFNDDVQVHK